MDRFPLSWLIGGILLLAVALLPLTLAPKIHTANRNLDTNLNTNAAASANSNTQNTVTTPPVLNLNSPAPNTNVSQLTVVVPMAGFFDRITKKPFGLYITPSTSPVQPEKFTGYHTGADAETTPAEASLDLPVQAMAAGTVIFAGHVNGYGGVIIIRHQVGSEIITALYGHLRIASFTVTVNHDVSVGQQIAVLGTGNSVETDGERKHLHFGLLPGAIVDYRGYVQQQSELSRWTDPVAWLHQHSVSS